MAESYFEMLTEQNGIPAKPFDPIGELKRIRQSLALRIQESNPQKTDSKTEDSSLAPLPIAKTAVVPIEPIALETMIQTVGNMKKTLAHWQRSKSRRRMLPSVSYREIAPICHSVLSPSPISQQLFTPQGNVLETVSAGLTALGIIGIVFGALGFFRGVENDLSLGFLVSISGLAVMVIGFGGRTLASGTALS